MSDTSLMFDFVNESTEQIKIASISVINWGPLHGHHEVKIDPEGTLITGDNGAGKSTLVDALMTLLRPSGSVSYNIAAAQDGKKDRSIVTYIRGSYGNSMVDGTQVTRNLRENSVISAVKAVYEFASGDYGVMPGMISDFYSSGDWMLAPRDVYINTDKICLMVNFKPELFDYRFVPGIKYVVSRGEEELFASDVIYLIEASTKLDFTAKNNKSSFNENGNLIDGTYEIRIEDEYGNEIKSYKCKVETKTYEKEEIVFKNNKNDYYLTNLVYEIKDDDLKSLSYPTKTGWWDYDVTSVGKSAFASNTKTLAFSLSVNADIERELYYDYYYSKTSDFKDINKATPVYSGSCKPSAYDDQSCYDLDYTSEKFEPGFYGLVVYSDASKTHIVLTAACIVVKETSQSVTGNN